MKVHNGSAKIQCKFIKRGFLLAEPEIGFPENRRFLGTATSSGESYNSPTFVHDKLAISVTAILLSAAGISWVASYYLMPLMMPGSEMMGKTGIAAIVSSLSLFSIGFFLLVWVIGMGAMMFPAMIPMVLFYDKVKTRVEKNPRLAKLAGTPLFLSGYLVTYALLGIGAYLAIYAAISLSEAFPIFATLSILMPSAILIATGVYQFSSLKTRCLSHCVSPFGFFATRSSNGLFGAFKMGFDHGTICVGCCWAYMIVMLAVGAMSIPVMIALAGVIALEKVIVKRSVWFNRSIAIGFIALGVLSVFFPSILSALQA